MKQFSKLLHKLFIPGKENNHHPLVISHFALTAYVVASLFCFVVLKNLSAQTGNVLGFATDVSFERILTLSNEARLQNGQKTLLYNEELSKAAMSRARDMFDKGYWAHFGPNGETPWTFITQSGYTYEYAGENLAKNFMTSQAIVDAWLKSPTHRANLLNPNYQDIGIAVINGTLSGEETTLVVQLFAKPSLLEKRQEEKAKTQSVPQNIQKAQSLPKKVAANEPTVTQTPSINLMPAFRIIVSFAIALLILVLTLDIYHLSKTKHHHHRGKHFAHLIFLFAVLIGIYYLGKGLIL